MYMKAFKPLRAALCVYESIRLAFLIQVLIILQPEGAMPFPWLALISPGALFLLMAVFWLIDMPRYALFRPLYLTGKTMSAVAVLFWLFLGKSGTMKQLLYGVAASFAVPGVLFFMLPGDMLSALAVLIIFKEKKRR